MILSLVPLAGSSQPVSSKGAVRTKKPGVSGIPRQNRLKAGRRREALDRLFLPAEFRSRKWHQTTSIPAKILAVVKQSDKHRIVVRILVRKYKGSFLTLKFGEDKPLLGFCKEGRLDLVYSQDPGLKEGQSFPLWTIQ
jgi:hypothetical protein